MTDAPATDAPVTEAAVTEAVVTEAGATEAEFFATYTIPTRPPLVPEMELLMASQITPIWQASEAWLAQADMEPPFWAFAWPGGQALARHVLDNPELVAGRRVLDFAAGGGVAAIACAMAGARVEACEIDPLAVAAMRANAARNRVEIGPVCADLVGSACRWDIILCGDVCYEAPMTRHILPWLRLMAGTCQVWVADPGRAYLPQEGMAPFATYVVPTSLELEDRTERVVRLFRLIAA
jgi:predicted nicotinamide N-methyase